MKQLAALVPVKDLASAKERLSNAADPATRAGLARAMLLDVLESLGKVPAIGACYVVSASDEVGALAHAAGVTFLREPADIGGLNDAVHWAVQHLAQDGWQSVLIVHGDLPLAQAKYFSALIESHGAGSGVTIAPAREDGGTNALLCSPPCAIPFCFGIESSKAHCDAAHAAGIEPNIFECERIGFDVDRPEDFAALRRACRKGACGTNTSRLFCAATPAIEHRTLPDLMAEAAAKRDGTYGNVVTYSRKVFIPVTRLCRDVCHYCTYAKTPRSLAKPYLSIEEMVDIARAGAAAGCKEALFTLGEKPELRYRAAAQALEEMGYGSTLEYLAAAAKTVFAETGLLPHLNPGTMSGDELHMLRPHAASMGLMLEGTAPSLCAKGGAHFGSPDKAPTVRLAAIVDAGKAKIPFTTGVLVGIGETREERLEALLAIADLHMKYDHIQEVIVQNFRAKPGTRMADAPEPDLDELLWSIAAARVLLPGEISIQAPPNLSPDAMPRLIAAGINDWGGVSPVTPDHVNPEAPWPHLDVLTAETAAAGKILQERLTVYPRYIERAGTWLDKAMTREVLRKADARGFARDDDGWVCGQHRPPPPIEPDCSDGRIDPELVCIAESAAAGLELSEAEITRAFESKGPEVTYLCKAADHLRKSVVGDSVSFVVNRNINYTNLCTYSCAFCAFAKGAKNRNLRGPAYTLDTDVIAERACEAWEQGASEVCLQGGIHPQYTGQTYIDICMAVKRACPDMHIHGFSPLEVRQGAETLGVSVDAFLAQLKEAGLSTLPGTAAEILDDEVRAVLCPDKLSSDEWVNVVESAHTLGLDTTSTIMFGHVDHPRHWARHLLKLRALQCRSLDAGAGKITEFVPLPFVPTEAPLFLRGRARMGPSFREVLLMHAVARLVLHPMIPNIQTSWVKLGDDGAAACLNAGANDLGGTLMNESISSAAGSVHGRQRSITHLSDLIRRCGRTPALRTTRYQTQGASMDPVAPIRAQKRENFANAAD